MGGRSLKVKVTTKQNGLSTLILFLLVMGNFMMFRSETTIRSLALRTQWGVNVLSPAVGNYDRATDDPSSSIPLDWSWLSTERISILTIEGDSLKCKGVIYSGDTRSPFATTGNGSYALPETPYIAAQWNAMSHLIRTRSAQNLTCLVFYSIASPYIVNGTLHNPVWARLPATRMMMETFPQANHFMYMDSDAILTMPDRSLPEMYSRLSYDGYGENATFQQLHPGLIVNKPVRGWLCKMCRKIGLGHGCINSGVLLWRRSRAAHRILHAWWHARLQSGNVFVDGSNVSFPFWIESRPPEISLQKKMGEQDRLMYIYARNESVQEDIWIVPRAASRDVKQDHTYSCPGSAGGLEHTPCLQNDISRDSYWNLDVDDSHLRERCYVNHYCKLGDSTKNILVNVSKWILTE